MKQAIILFFLFVMSVIYAPCQQPFTFHQLTAADGLNDGWVRDICQDKYGYMWFSTLGALNRFNGRNIKRFTHSRNDSTSPPPSVCNTMACGPDGRLWLSFWNEIVEFDYSSLSFKKIQIATGFNVNTIIPVSKDKVFMASTSGLHCYNPVTDRFEELAVKGDTTTKKLIEKTPAYHACIKGELLYIGTNKGYIVYNTVTKKATFYPVKELEEKNINRIMVDKNGYIWISHFESFKFIRINSATGKAETLDHLLKITGSGVTGNAINFIETDDNEIWIQTNLQGLFCYNTITKKVSVYRNDFRSKGTLLSNTLFSIYGTKDGTIWVGSGIGLNYFNPRKNLFTIRYPFADSSHTLSRGVDEDHEGNLWFTTGNGISTYNVKTGKYTTWQNQQGKPDVIYFNSVRGIAEDANHDIWVATGKGVNRLNRATGKMDFLTIKDSIPETFYFSINKTSNGTLWFGARDYDGLYYYKPTERKFYGISTHPVLKKFKGHSVRHVFEDSKKRLWIGYNGEGLLMYDRSTGATKHWRSIDKGDKTIIGDVITSVREDKNGKIWVSTYNGITCIDADKNEFTSYTEKDGLKTNIVGGIAIDDSNRIWLGTAAGLVMLEKSRQHFTSFGEEMGLNVTDFNEHPAFTLSTGEIMMPSSQGYVIFNPMHFKEDIGSISCFIASIKISGDRDVAMQFVNRNEQLDLEPSENFFTIELESVNLNNPDQTWYAYKLEGLDKDWHYSQEPKAIYTSVPGGNYTFRYKATSNVNNWSGEEKKLDIHIATVFYKASWFWIMTGLVLSIVLIFFYRSRLNRQKLILTLETKAESLEKEKTMVQYESLKQHLNPHFLFNSLTSLRSLIRSDSKTATSFLDGMSRIFRYVLKSGEQELVRLQDELDFVKTFVELQKTRFREGLEVNINVEESCFNKYVAPVTLQNLIENAIKHNTADKDSPLVIDIFIENGFVVVRNNLQRYKIVETSNKKGLKSLKTLYSYYSDKPMEIMEDEKYFTIKIPLL